MLTNWIDGRAQKSLSVDAIEVINPATEEVIESIPRGVAGDSDAAVQSAAAAQSGWAALSPAERVRAFDSLLVKYEDHRDRIADILAKENGKPRAKAMFEVDMFLRLLRENIDLSIHIRSGVQGAAAGDLNFQHRQPRGVAACIIPWNFPLLAAVEVIVPNLVIGNTVVWKPSEKTPLSSRYMAEHIFGDLPPGVLNLVLGDGLTVGEPLVQHPRTDLVCFIGSEPTGRRIGAFCGQALKKCILELGGKDAMIVDETVSPRDAARLAALAAFENTGQICTSTERIYVHSSIFDEFVGHLTGEAEKIKIGGSHDPESRLGPMTDKAQLEKVASQVERAVAAGAKVHTGGRKPDSVGYFFPPTVLTHVSHDMDIMKEETFGPIAPVMAFDDFDQAIAMANDTRFGLAAIVCTDSGARGIQALQQLNAGMVKINTLRGKAHGATSEPFGASGIGHGYGTEFFHEITRQKSVHWRAELATE